MRIELVHFSIGKPKQMKYSEDKEMITGICKDSTEEAFLSKDGFLGDDVADLKHHGGEVNPENGTPIKTPKPLVP